MKIIVKQIKISSVEEKVTSNIILFRILYNLYNKNYHK